MTILEANIALGQLDTRISALIQEAETLLLNSISVRISVPWNGKPVAWGKVNGKWHLTFDEVPLASCSREVRAAFFAENVLQLLYEAALPTLERRIQARYNAIAAGEALLFKLKEVL